MLKLIFGDSRIVGSDGGVLLKFAQRQSVAFSSPAFAKFSVLCYENLRFLILSLTVSK